MSQDCELVVATPLRIEAHALRRGLRGVRVVRTGMGTERSRSAAARLLADPAGALAIAGLCGGLDPSLAPGDVVVASELAGGDAPGPAPESHRLCAVLRELGIEPRVGRVLSVDHVVRGAERERLRAGGALAVDMESAWLARAAGNRPFCVLRVVVDAPGREIVRPAAVCDGLFALRRLAGSAPALAVWAALAPAPGRLRRAPPAAELSQ